MQEPNSSSRPRRGRIRLRKQLAAVALVPGLVIAALVSGAGAAPCLNCPDKGDTIGRGTDVDPTPTTRPPTPPTTAPNPTPAPTPKVGPCEATPADAPLRASRVSCSKDGLTKVELDSFVTPVINTVGTVLRVFYWREHTGLFGWGGPGWVEVPAPADDAWIYNRHIDVQVGGITYYDNFNQQCEARRTVYINPNPFGPPQFQCMTWGFQVGIGDAGGVATPILELVGRAFGRSPGSVGPSIDFNVAAGKHVFGSGRVRVNGENIAAGPTFK